MSSFSKARSTAEVPAVTISFAAIEDTSAIFLAQLTADAEPDDAALTLTVHYYLNDQQIENFTPQQRMEAGPHTLALFYPFANVEANTVKRLSVRLVCSGGTVRVAQYGIKATVTGQGMAGETPWNGLLECEELVAPVRLTPRTLVLDFGGVGFMDSSGIGLILGRQRCARTLGGTLRIQHAPEALRRVLQLANIPCVGGESGETI